MKKLVREKTKRIITILVVTYNNETTIENCIDSIFKNTLFDFQKKIIIIDNNSQDGTSKILKKLSTDKRITKIILNNFNAGFGKTINTELKQKSNSDSEFFFLLNPDASLASNALSRLLRTADTKEKVALLSCTIIHPISRKILFKEGSIDFLRLRTTHTAPSKFQLSYVTGCALLIRKTLLDEIGTFDPNFFLYYEDADLSIRTLSTGMGIATEVSAVCYHEESHSSTSERKNYFLTRNALYFFHKHYPFFALPYFWIAFFTRFIYHKYFSRKKVVVRAMRDFWYSRKNNRLV